MEFNFSDEKAFGVLKGLNFFHCQYLLLLVNISQSLI
jgi:hypothetical protein